MERALRLKLPNGRFENITVGHSARMRAIKDKGNRSTEVRARAILVRSGTRGWVVHPHGLPGKPDFYFLQIGVVLFIDGCYWHGCAQVPACSVDEPSVLDCQDPRKYAARSIQQPSTAESRLTRHSGLGTRAKTRLQRPVDTKAETTSRR